jgi:hypothetical protein
VSIRVMTTVWDYSEAAGTDLLVLLALADIADENGECWPSVGYIARKCRISGRTVQRCVRSLESLGEVVVIIEGGKASTAGGTRSNRYRIVVHMPEEVGGDILTGGDAGDGGGVTPVGLSGSPFVNINVGASGDAEITAGAFVGCAANDTANAYLVIDGGTPDSIFGLGSTAASAGNVQSTRRLSTWLGTTLNPAVGHSFTMAYASTSGTANFSANYLKVQPL